MTTEQAMQDLWGLYCHWEYGTPFESQPEACLNYIYEMLGLGVK